MCVEGGDGARESETETQEGLERRGRKIGEDSGQATHTMFLFRGGSENNPCSPSAHMLGQTLCGIVSPLAVPITAESNLRHLPKEILVSLKFR